MMRVLLVSSDIYEADYMERISRCEMEECLRGRAAREDDVPGLLRHHDHLGT